MRLLCSAETKSFLFCIGFCSEYSFCDKNWCTAHTHGPHTSKFRTAMWSVSKVKTYLVSSFIYYSIYQSESCIFRLYIWNELKDWYLFQIFNFNNFWDLRYTKCRKFCQFEFQNRKLKRFYIQHWGACSHIFINFLCFLIFET